MRSDEAETYQVTTSNCQYGPPGPPVEELLSGFSMASQGPVCGQWGLFQIMPNGGNPTINQTSGDGLIIIPELSHYYPKDYYSPKNYGLIIIPLSQKSVHILPEIPQSLPQGLTYTRLLRGFRMVRVLLGPRIPRHRMALEKNMSSM